MSIDRNSLSRKISVVLPAKNEAGGLAQVLPKLRAMYEHAELIVVDDGSRDDTGVVASKFADKVVSHPYSKGNGAAIKSGARAATREFLLFMDADGQHRPEDIELLLIPFVRDELDMVVGARSLEGQAGAHRALANGFYNRLASWMVGHRIGDLTSGFRVVRATKFRQFLYLLPNGFSYPTTSTMCFFRAGYSVAYVPIIAPNRIGRSHIRLFRDGARFVLIIFKIGTLYSPLKLFLPISATFFLIGLSYYGYTFLSQHRFTNMSALLFVTSVLVFLIGLVSEQITALMFKDDSGGE
jgi:glycosyltransferase involved in cell wall biosynthesis